MEDDRFRKDVIERLDVLIRLVAVNTVKGKPLVESILTLSELGFGNIEIATMLGTTANYVSKVKWENKKEKISSQIKEPEFQPEDLQNVLSNINLFRSNEELVSFAVEILRVPIAYSDKDTRYDTVRRIISVFQNSDKRKQALFIQALERRADSRELKDTQFLKFLQGWEAHIKG